VFSFWFWLRATFQAVFVMEVEERGRRRIVGFAGLYGMEMGRSLWLSLAVLIQKTGDKGMGNKRLAFFWSPLKHRAWREAFQSRFHGKIFRPYISSETLVLRFLRDTRIACFSRRARMRRFYSHCH